MIYPQNHFCRKDYKSLKPERRHTKRMINGHKPTRMQKKLLVKNNKNCNEWLVVKTISTKTNGCNTITYQFRNKMTNETILISEDGNIVSK